MTQPSPLLLKNKTTKFFTPTEIKKWIEDDLVPIHQLSKLFDYSLEDAAKNNAVCTTLLKKSCRKYGIRRWPFRQLQSINRAIRCLKIAKLVSMNEKKRCIISQIKSLRQKKQGLITKITKSAVGNYGGCKNDVEKNKENITTPKGYHSQSVVNFNNEIKIQTLNSNLYGENFLSNGNSYNLKLFNSNGLANNHQKNLTPPQIVYPFELTQSFTSDQNTSRQNYLKTKKELVGCSIQRNIQKTSFHPFLHQQHSQNGHHFLPQFSPQNQLFQGISFTDTPNITPKPNFGMMTIKMLNQIPSTTFSQDQNSKLCLIEYQNHPNISEMQLIGLKVNKHPQQGLSNDFFYNNTPNLLKPSIQNKAVAINYHYIQQYAANPTIQGAQQYVPTQNPNFYKI